MISICIPVYNFDIGPLLNGLSKQISQTGFPTEIIVVDDASNEKYKILNRGAAEKAVYIELQNNIGRSKIRNTFLQHAKFDYLLFLDCDSLVATNNFVANYVEVINQSHPQVVCGGRVYPTEYPGRAKRLRWEYGLKKESQPCNIRKLAPNKSFMTNNFLINRKTFEKIKFDERISSYGHEDTLFGYELKKQGVGIMHIENPILNGDIETNSTFLSKTEVGVINLVNILKYIGFDKNFISDVTLLNYYNQLNISTIFIFNFIFSLTKPIIKYMIIKGFVSLRVFDFYKLGILIKNYPEISGSTV